MNKTCKTCGILNPKLLKCQLFGHQVNPNIDFCSKHTTEVMTCEVCGMDMPKTNTIIEVRNGESIRILCERCLNAIGTCKMCKHGSQCLFETDPSPLPKVVEKIFRQGLMTTVTQIKNPERIDYCCKEKKCPCFSEEYNDCMENYNCCEKCEDI